MSSESSARICPDVYPGLVSKPVLELELAGERHTRGLGAAIGRRAKSGDFVGLVGSLGAGKTTLVQGLVRQFDPQGQHRATSPTYALIQLYETSPPVYHIDLYRLEGWADLESIGYWDVVDAGRGVCCVEWLDRIPGGWPGDGLIVELIGSGQRRRARLWAGAQWAGRFDSFDETSLNDSQSQDKP